MILIAVLYALCAATFTISKKTLLYTQPIFYVGVRMMLAGIVILTSYKAVHSTRYLIQSLRRDWWLFAQIILFHIYIAYVTDLWSLQYITSIESAVIFSLSPFAAALFSYLWFRERMTSKKWIGLLLGFGSIGPIIYDAWQKGMKTSGILPVTAVLVSVLSSAYGWVLMRELVKDRGHSPLSVNGLGMIGGGILAFVTSVCTEPWIPSPVTQWWPFLALTLLIILVANIGFKNLYGYLLTRYTATFISFAGFTCPFFATLFGWLFLGEPITWDVLYAVAVVTTGLTLFYQEELRQGYIKQR